MGIGGLWLAILLSGVHATIAAVLAAFAIPNTKRINTPLFLRKTKLLAYEIKEEFRNRNKHPKEADDHISHTIQKFTSLTEDATPPLQRLEHALYPFVSFVVLPIFAFANAGVSLGNISFEALLSPVTIGVMFGLIFGKFIGIVFFSRLMVWTKIASLPHKVKWKHVYGIGFLAAIGFTMSLFITELAFENENYLAQAKIGILSASLIAGLIGYFYLRKTGNE